MTIHIPQDVAVGYNFGSYFIANTNYNDVNIPQTAPITDVWSGIMEWITGSLAAVQGVFVSNNSVRPLLSDQFVSINGTTLYLLPASSPTPNVLYYQGINLDSVDFTIENIDDFDVHSLDGVPLMANAIVDGGLSIYLNPELTLSANGSNLTFLGTLAVIGVSIGIGFLLIGLIQKFLKLRG